MLRLKEFALEIVAVVPHRQSTAEAGVQHDKSVDHAVGRRINEVPKHHIFEVVIRQALRFVLEPVRLEHDPLSFLSTSPMRANKKRDALLRPHEALDIVADTLRCGGERLDLRFRQEVLAVHVQNRELAVVVRHHRHPLHQLLDVNRDARQIGNRRHYEGALHRTQDVPHFVFWSGLSKQMDLRGLQAFRLFDYRRDKLSLDVPEGDFVLYRQGHKVLGAVPALFLTLVGMLLGGARRHKIHAFPCPQHSQITLRSLREDRLRFK